MKIVKIHKENYSGKVYNFHCLPNENYFSHGILVHNCYKSNGTSPTKHMSLETFKKIMNKMPSSLTQIAFGLTNTEENPDFWNILEECRRRDIVPNYTTHGLDITPEIAQKTAKLCGAVAVSIVNKEKSYDSIKMFCDAGMKQVNIHYVLSEETYNNAFKIIDDIKHDNRLKNLNAIVFLQYKPKGKNKEALHSLLNIRKYKVLINYCDMVGVRYGFDSCSAHLYLKSIKDNPLYNYDILSSYVDPCESVLFSLYCSVDGKVYPCSFTEDENDWNDGLDLVNCNDFLNDIWFHPRMVKWRETLLENKRNCPVFKLEITNEN